MSQEQDILNYLKCGNKLTPLEAVQLFGCMRLGARIYDLKEKGYPIDSRTVKKGKKYVAEYEYISSEQFKMDFKWK